MYKADSREDDGRISGGYKRAHLSGVRNRALIELPYKGYYTEENLEAAVEDLEHVSSG